MCVFVCVLTSCVCLPECVFVRDALIDQPAILVGRYSVKISINAFQSQIACVCQCSLLCSSAVTADKNIPTHRGGTSRRRSLTPTLQFPCQHCCCQHRWQPPFQLSHLYVESCEQAIPGPGLRLPAGCHCNTTECHCNTAIPDTITKQNYKNTICFV